MREKDYKKMYEKMIISADMEEKISNGVMKQKKNSFKWASVAAAVAVLCLVVGGSVSATIHNGNLFSFLSKEYKISDQANHMVEHNKKFPVIDNKDLTCTIKEALCDKKVVYCMAEVQIKNHDKYFLLDHKRRLKEFVDELEIDGVKGKTIGQYLKEIKKKPLYVSAYIKSAEDGNNCYDGSIMSTDIRYGKDGKVFLYMSVEDENESIHNIDFYLIGWNAKYNLLKTFENKEELTLENNSDDFEEHTYKTEEEIIYPEEQIKIKDVRVLETELGVYATVEYEVPKDKFEKKQEKQDYCETYEVDLADKDGTPLKTMQSWRMERTAEETCYRSIAHMNYEKADISEGLTLVVHNGEKILAGPYALK